MRTTAIREKRLRAILRLLDPQKVKTSLVLMMGMLLVSGLVLLSAYLQARRQMEDTSRDLVARRAAENAVLLDRSLKSFQQTLYSLAVDKDIFWLKNWNQYEDTVRLDLYYSASTRIRSIKVPDGNLLGLFACFPSQNIVLADGIHRMSQYDTLAQPEWQGLKTNELNIFCTSADTPEGVALNSVRIAHKVGYNVNETGFVVMQLKPEVVTDLLGAGSDLDGEAVHVEDAAGRVLFTRGNLTAGDWEQLIGARPGSGGMVRLGREAYFVVSQRIGITGWTYRIAVPRLSLIAGQRFETGMTLTVGALIVIALAFAALGTQYAYRPLERLYRSVAGRFSRTEHADRSDYLSRVFDRVFAENHDLRAMVSRNLPLLQEKALMQLVMQPPADGSNEAALESLQIRFKHPHFRVAVVCYHQDDPGVSPAELLRVECFNEFWQERLSGQGDCRMVLIEPRRFFIIINYSEPAKDGVYWRDWFNEGVRAFCDAFGRGMTGGISLVKTSLAELNVAFLEALRTFERQLVVGPGFVEIYEKQIRFGELRLVYPFELLQKLLNVLRTTDTDRPATILAEIGAFLKNNPPRSEFALRQIFLHMSGTLRQLLLEIDIDSEDELVDCYMDNFMKARDIDSHMAALAALAEHIQECYIRYYGGRRQTLYEQIRDYIRQNFENIRTPEEIASHFYISVTYLYRLMKNIGNTSPAHYLTQLRAERAAQLLRESDMTVADVSSACGFESEQSFYRNFKRMHGCTPSQYRNAARCGSLGSR
ncbi:MAG: helix-turn-helix domain-containing protein [Christensenellales bacterium]|jgi:AraC-like DNA-binding protein